MGLGQAQNAWNQGGLTPTGGRLWFQNKSYPTQEVSPLSAAGRPAAVDWSSFICRSRLSRCRWAAIVRGARTRPDAQRTGHQRPLRCAQPSATGPTSVARQANRRAFGSGSPGALALAGSMRQAVRWHHRDDARHPGQSASLAAKPRAATESGPFAAGKAQRHAGLDTLSPMAQAPASDRPSHWATAGASPAPAPRRVSAPAVARPLGLGASDA